MNESSLMLNNLIHAVPLKEAAEFISCMDNQGSSS